MPDLHYEKLHGFLEGKIICGVDEVGRGPLAGPVVAAAIILPANLPQNIESQIRDSKKMSVRKREMIFPVLTKFCKYAVAEASVTEIDSLNILHASLLAMQRAINNLGIAPDHILVDGRFTPKNLPCPATPITGGDNKCLSIAAASIIAKVTRDRIMKKLAEQHPGYGWEKNAGYGTAQHIEALKRLGPTIWHRDSFAPVYQLKAVTK